MMQQYLLDSIENETINNEIETSFMMMEYYLKKAEMETYSNDTVYQEARSLKEMWDSDTSAIHGREGEGAFMRVIKFLPRLIRNIIKWIANSVKSLSEAKRNKKTKDTEKKIKNASDEEKSEVKDMLNDLEQNTEAEPTPAKPQPQQKEEREENYRLADTQALKDIIKQIKEYIQDLSDYKTHKKITFKDVLINVYDNNMVPSLVIPEFVNEFMNYIIGCTDQLYGIMTSLNCHKDIKTAITEEDLQKQFDQLSTKYGANIVTSRQSNINNRKNKYMKFVNVADFAASKMDFDRNAKVTINNLNKIGQELGTCDEKDRTITNSKNYKTNLGAFANEARDESGRTIQELNSRYSGKLAMYKKNDENYVRIKNEKTKEFENNRQIKLKENINSLTVVLYTSKAELERLLRDYQRSETIYNELGSLLSEYHNRKQYMKQTYGTKQTA